MLSPIQVQELTEKLAAFICLLQYIEILLLRAQWCETGVWRWSILRREFAALPSPLVRLADLLLGDRGFLALLVLGIMASLTIFFQASALNIAVILTVSLLISLRWRGSFNGGSDSMLLIILMALVVCHAFGGYDSIRRAALCYVGVQSVLSYFLAGLAKLRSTDWRSGRGLAAFISSSIYKPPPFVEFFLTSRLLSRIVAWFVIGFELSFFVAPLLLAQLKFFLFFGLIFHFCIFFTFGLNRFFFTWIATYPALYFLALSFEPILAT